MKHTGIADEAGAFRTRPKSRGRFRSFCQGNILNPFAHLSVEQLGQPEDELNALGKLCIDPTTNIIKVPNISASVPRLRAAIIELQAKDCDLPNFPENPQAYDQKQSKTKVAKIMGSAVNPVLREGNSDRRVPKAVKDYPKKHPHKFGAWPVDPKTTVGTMGKDVFFSNEKSTTLAAATEVRIEFIRKDGSTNTLLFKLALKAGENMDAAKMGKKSLIEKLHVAVEERDGYKTAGVANERLYTTSEDMLADYEVLIPAGGFVFAATIGHVHVSYKPGAVKLNPTILHEAQKAVMDKPGAKGEMDLLFHGGSGTPLEDICETLSSGIIKMNTDTQYAFTCPIVDHSLKTYDRALIIVLRSKVHLSCLCRSTSRSSRSCRTARHTSWKYYAMGPHPVTGTLDLNSHADLVGGIEQTSPQDICETRRRSLTTLASGRARTSAFLIPMPRLDRRGHVNVLATVRSRCVSIGKRRVNTFPMAAHSLTCSEKMVVLIAHHEQRRKSGLPQKQGLYDPQFKHDASSNNLIDQFSATLDLRVAPRSPPFLS